MIRVLFLIPVSWLFGALVALKNALYDRGVLKTRKLPAKVISIGNLAMGGTGKSPVTIDLTTRLLAMGKQVTVLSRGYGRRNPKTAHQVDASKDWRDYGDEPTMIALRCPEAAVCVGPSRYEAAQIRQERPDVYVIDDGFQHRQLHRDVDVVLIDLTAGLPELFPRKLFREGMGALKRAHLVVLTRWQGQDTATMEAAIRAANPEIPILKLGVGNFRLLDLTGTPVDLPTWTGRRVAAYAGIARPERFFQSLESLGFDLVQTLALKDHEPFAGQRAERFLQQCLAADVTAVITTEKDAVKLEKTPDNAIINAFLTIDVVWEDAEQVDQILHRIWDNG